jgi:hypothetical protein
MEIARMISSSEKRLREMSEKQAGEILELQAAHDKKNAELHTALHDIEVQRRRAADVRDPKKYLKDGLTQDDKRSMKDSVTIARLTGPNHVLIESLHILQSVAEQRISPQSDRRSRSSVKLNNVPEEIDSALNDDDDDDFVHGDASVSSQIQTTCSTMSSRAASFIRKSSSVFNPDDLGELSRIQIDPSMKDEKLRNSLLTMSREKYRMTKKVEILGDEVEILKTKLEMSELKCRHLQIVLAEVRGTDDTTPFVLSLMGNIPPLVKPKDFGPVDELFKVRSYGVAAL